MEDMLGQSRSSGDPDSAHPTGLQERGRNYVLEGLNHSEPCDGLTIGTLTSADTPILRRIHTLVTSSSISPYCISGPSMELRTASLGK
jgi:hypothetical protein